MIPVKAGRLIFLNPASLPGAGAPGKITLSTSSTWSCGSAAPDPKIPWDSDRPQTRWDWDLWNSLLSINCALIALR